MAIKKLKPVKLWQIPERGEQSSYWDRYMDSLRELATRAEKSSNLSPKETRLLIRMANKLEKGQALTVGQRNDLEDVLRHAKQEGLLQFLDPPISSESSHGGFGVKEPPHDIELHKKIGPPQKYGDDL